MGREVRSTIRDLCRLFPFQAPPQSRLEQCLAHVAKRLATTGRRLWPRLWPYIYQIAILKAPEIVGWQVTVCWWPGMTTPVTPQEDHLGGQLRSIERYGSKSVPVLVLLAVLITLAAAIQTMQVRNDYQDRDKRATEASAQAVERFVTTRTNDQDALIDRFARSTGGKTGGVSAALSRSLETEVLRPSPEWVVGVIALARDGRVVATVERTRGALGDQELIETAASLSEVVSKEGVQRVSARVEVNDGPGVISAVPVTARVSSLQSIAFVYDLKASPLGTAFEVPTTAADGGVTLADGNGKALLGTASAQDRGGIQKKVAGTDWTVRREASIVPSAVAPWIYVALLALVIFVAVTSARRDRERKRLRREVDEAQTRIAALKRFADDVLRAESSDELAQILAEAVVKLGIGDGAGVRMARPQAEELLVGSTVGNVSRTAVVGGGRPLAELRIWNGTELDDDALSLLSALVATCGTAMNTLDVLERERSTAGELAKLDHLRVNLLSTVAHELRSPLTAVKGVLELLEMSDGLNDKQQEYVGVAGARTDALIGLIADLLDASLLESGQLRLETERLDAHEAVRHALGAELAAHPDDLIIDVAADLKLTADPVRLGQILRNLVSNAFRYGSAPVAVLADRVGDRARIVVVDSGAGVPIADRERIFSRFVQGHDGDRASSGGVGIGLALVKSLVGLHGGEIELTGATGASDAKPSGALAGARFALTFPDVTPDNAHHQATVHPLDDVRAVDTDDFATGT